MLTIKYLKHLYFLSSSLKLIKNYFIEIVAYMTKLPEDQTWVTESDYGSD